MLNEGEWDTEEHILSWRIFNQTLVMLCMNQNILHIGKHMSVSMYYNPKCSKCRATLAVLQEKGIEPELIFYLETAPSAAELEEVLKKLGKGPKDISTVTISGNANDLGGLTKSAPGQGFSSTLA